MMTETDLYCLGGASLDLVLRTQVLPISGEKLVVELAGRQPGGLVANTACAAARLGLKTGWAGSIGGGEWGWILLDSFTEFGVDARLAEMYDRQTGDFTIILLEPSGERTILVVPVFDRPPGLHPEVISALEKTRVAYSIPYDLEWFYRVEEAVHAGGGLVALDVESSSPVKGAGLRKILRRADIVFCDRSGLKMASGEGDVAAGAKALLELGAGLVCVTLGAQGAAVFSKQEQAWCDAFQVPVVDQTGAGDCFHAAFLAAWLEEMPLEPALQFANASAGLSVQKLGARGGLPSREEVATFLAAHAGD